MPEKNTITHAVMLVMFAENGFVEEAEDVFQEIVHRNTILWGAMHCCYAQNGDLIQAKNANICEAKKTFDRIPTWNLVSWNTMLAAYAMTGHAYSAIQLFWVMFLHGFDPDKAAFPSF
ncbi:pentatricopeptide repeat-containing protein At4g02750-like [Selaginella moellendorffii]|uniref:pentatricopeptide repeat-containing protein At4g02750-like n=1 Tax=Selaginella moellendorffii TaxID=88036 RepID=UPI000D1CE9DD|nr:pentatricopeptide repeat-containing protein At4g02750-like [Selaginella moellendorffii]|eukprot:XP_024536025.1 pentatricopeptide repeat-containing protein At4g02750-like [Selaginella moellendorffii]